MRHSILRMLRDAGGARAQRVPIKFSALASSFALPITDERSARTNSIACMTLVWSPESIHDLISLRAHIAEHDPAAAKRVEHLLSENPQLGNPGRVPGTRELVIPKTPYIVPYRIRATTIEIARVYRSSRRWPERL